MLGTYEAQEYSSPEPNGLYNDEKYDCACPVKRSFSSAVNGFHDELLTKRVWNFLIEITATTYVNGSALLRIQEDLKHEY